MDYSVAQMDYLKELLSLRYRLNEDDIANLDEKEIRKIILGKDEKLNYKEIYAQYQPKINKQSVINKEDTLMEKLFGEARANTENPHIKRSVTITIDDKINK